MEKEIGSLEDRGERNFSLSPFYKSKITVFNLRT